MKNLYIRKKGVVKNIKDDFGIYHKSVPYVLFPKVKEPFKNSWYDENGDDEYLPAVPTYESYEMKIDFVYEGTLNSANNKIKDFLSFLQGGYFEIYDEYSGIGRQKVRYVSVDTDGYLYRREKDVVEFSVTFKVNDPITQITL